MNRRTTATTLIEILLYIGLLSVVITSISGLLSQILSARNKQLAVTEVENEAAYVLQLIERGLREAGSVSVPSSNSSGNTLTYTKSESPAYTRTYSLTGTTVQQTTAPGSTVGLTSNNVNFSNFSVAHRDGGSTYHIVTVSFTASHTNSGNKNEFSYQKNYQTSVVLRPNL